MILFLVQYTLFIGKPQNLVPNPSFEDTVACPAWLAAISNASNWTSASFGSPDYFHTCNSEDANIPDNIFGSQAALTGNAYVGISAYDTLGAYSYREYIQVQLQQSLEAAQRYWVSFHVSLADLNDYAIKELGAYFSVIQISDPDDTTLLFTPQIEFSDSVISDKVNWVRIHGTFTATGGESYLVIGNFNRTQTTTALQVGSTNVDYAYYYIDDVCVADDSITCTQLMSINVVNNKKPTFNVYPNPVANYF